jgi:hypothetical protein
MLKDVIVSPTDSGTYIFSCSKCHNVLQNDLGAQNQDQLIYVLVCSPCERIAGEWKTEQERDRALLEYAAKRMV